MAGVRHHREGHDGQDRLQQPQVVLVKALRPVRREGVADPGAARRVPFRAKADDLRKIIGRTGRGELFEDRKIEERLGSVQTPAQM